MRSPQSIGRQLFPSLGSVRTSAAGAFALSEARKDAGGPSMSGTDLAPADYMTQFEQWSRSAEGRAWRS